MSMERRTFIQTLAGAGLAVPLSKYLAQARPINPAEGMLIEAPLAIGDQIMMIFPDDAFEDWFLLCLKPTGQRIQLMPNEHFRKFWIYAEPIYTGTIRDGKGFEWASYEAGEMVFAFKYYGKLIRTWRVGTAEPARFRIGSVDRWKDVEGKGAYEIAWGDKRQGGIMTPSLKGLDITTL